jgi:putative flippase GtrA
VRPSWTSLTRRQRSTTGQGADATGARPGSARSRRWSARWRASAVHTQSDALTQWIKGKIPARFHKISDEIAKFGAIGLINIALNLAVVNLLWQTTYFSGSEVKAKAVATVVAATSAYFMNRHWTYRDRPKSSLRREYTLFFAFNLVGLIIETAAVYLAKYGLHRSDWLTLNAFTGLGIAIGTVFRFWAYRTHVFKLAPATVVVTTALPEDARLVVSPRAKAAGRRARTTAVSRTPSAPRAGSKVPLRISAARPKVVPAKIVPAPAKGPAKTPTKTPTKTPAATETAANR